MGMVSSGTRSAMSGMMGHGVWSVASKLSGWYGVYAKWLTNVLFSVGGVGVMAFSCVEMSVVETEEGLTLIS